MLLCVGEVCNQNTEINKKEKKPFKGICQLLKETVETISKHFKFYELSSFSTSNNPIPQSQLSTKSPTARSIPDDTDSMRRYKTQNRP